MPGKRSKDIAEYIRAAPSEAQPHLRRLHKILKSVAPEAEETIKWGMPFFVEPRFLFAFAAYKAHLNLIPIPTVPTSFTKELANHKTTKNALQVRYDEPLPEDLIRKIAEFQVQHVNEREDETFW
jgi:uncharacterized protein YdhG (YjbR/CyaY superfamily)